MKIKKVNDYVEEVHKLYPEIPEEEIKRILVYGWKMILQYVSFGNDVSILSNKFFFFIGRIPSSALSAFHTYCYKLSKRIRYMFKRTGSKWDGYYYFARSEPQYIDYLNQSKKKYYFKTDILIFQYLSLKK